jgi:hypothetical protein
MKESGLGANRDKERQMPATPLIDYELLEEFNEKCETRTC